MDVVVHAQKNGTDNTLNNNLRNALNDNAVADFLLALSNLSTFAHSEQTFYLELSKSLAALIPFDRFYVLNCNTDFSDFQYSFFVNKDKIPHQDEACIGLKSLNAYVAKNASPLICNISLMKEMAVAGDISYFESDCQYWLVVPVINKGMVTGVVGIQSWGFTSYGQTELNIMTFISQHIAFMLTRIASNKTQEKVFFDKNQQKTDQTLAPLKLVQLKNDIFVLKRKNSSLHQVNEQLSKKVQSQNLHLEKLNHEFNLEIQKREKLQQQLIFDASHDVLTETLNRKSFTKKVKFSIDDFIKHSSNFALLFIDLDRFKRINDTLGHKVGDEYLVNAVSRIKSAVRGDDVIGRFGGDEFVILLEHIQTRLDVEDVAQRILKSLSAPCKARKFNLRISASIGITLSNQNNDCLNKLFMNKKRMLEELFRQADKAMYQAKANGRGCFVVYDPVLDLH